MWAQLKSKTTIDLFINTDMFYWLYKDRKHLQLSLKQFLLIELMEIVIPLSQFKVKSSWKIFFPMYFQWLWLEVERREPQEPGLNPS